MVVQYHSLANATSVHVRRGGGWCMVEAMKWHITGKCNTKQTQIVSAETMYIFEEL